MLLMKYSVITVRTWRTYMSVTSQMRTRTRREGVWNQRRGRQNPGYNSSSCTPVPAPPAPFSFQSLPQLFTCVLILMIYIKKTLKQGNYFQYILILSLKISQIYTIHFDQTHPHSPLSVFSCHSCNLCCPWTWVWDHSLEHRKPTSSHTPKEK